jgi:hypothetical protein
MYILIVRGPRRAVLAVHHCDSSADLAEMLEIYHALGYADESLQVEERREKAA